MTAMFAMFAGSTLDCLNAYDVPIPAVDRAAAMVLVANPSDRSIKPLVIAFSFDESKSLDLALGLTLPAAELYALYYDCTTDGLGLPSRRDLGSRDGTVLPYPSTVLRYDNASAEWQQLHPTGTSTDGLFLPEELNDVRIASKPPRLPLCDFRETSFEVPSSTTAPVLGVAARVGPDSAVVGPAGGPFFLVTSDDGQGIAHTNVDLPGHPLAAYGTGDGELWLLDSNGDLSRGVLGGRFDVVATTRPGATMAAIDRAPTSTGADFFIAREEPGDAVHLPIRFFERARSGLAIALQMQRPLAPFAPLILASVGAHEALAVLSSTIARYNGVAVIDFYLSGLTGCDGPHCANLEPAFSMAYAPKRGTLLVGTQRGRLGEVDTKTFSAWSTYTSSATPISMVGEFRHGVLSGDTSGSIYAAQSDCNPGTVGRIPWRFVPLQSGFLVVSKNTAIVGTPPRIEQNQTNLTVTLFGSCSRRGQSP